MPLHPMLRPSVLGLSIALLVPISASCGGETGSGGSTGGSAGGGADGGAGGTTSSSGGSGTTCEDVCPAVVAAGCPNGPPDIAGCESGCASVIASCGAEFNALLACGGANPTYVCDAGGTPFPMGCDAESAALGDCISGVPAVCAAICPSVVAAGCPSGPPDEASCEAGCGDGKTKCPAEFAALEQCVPDAPTAACDANGSPYVEGCQTETLDLLTCLSMP